MTSKPRFFHTSGLRQEQIEPVAGHLMVILRKPITLTGHDPDLEVSVQFHLKAGDVLYAQADLPDVPDAVDHHLHGTVLQSEVRFGAGILLGLEPAMRHLTPLGPIQENRIDEWLDRYTVFVIADARPDYPACVGQRPVGLFDGIRHHWITHWDAQRTT